MGIDHDGEALPLEFGINNVYPNPFNSSATITYSLPRSENIRFVMYDLSGREAMVLVNGLTQQGRHLIRFNADSLPSGVYIARLTGEGDVATRKLLLLR